MVAAVLFVIGLVSVLISIVLVGYSAPALYQQFSTALSVPDVNYISVLADFGAALNWTTAPLLGGLLLMGFARVIMLLNSIDRSLKGGA